MGENSQLPQCNPLSKSIFWIINSNQFHCNSQGLNRFRRLPGRGRQHWPNKAFPNSLAASASCRERLALVLHQNSFSLMGVVVLCALFALFYVLFSWASFAPRVNPPRQREHGHGLQPPLRGGPAPAGEGEVPAGRAPPSEANVVLCALPGFLRSQPHPPPRGTI